VIAIEIDTQSNPEVAHLLEEIARAIRTNTMHRHELMDGSYQIGSASVAIAIEEE
jgi:hypothetical protein